MIIPPYPVYVDCDTGIDDALALTYLVASPRAELRGVGCVSGNIDAAGAARNTLNLLALLGRPDIPVAIGAGHPLTGEFGGGAPQVHGANGIGEVELPWSPAEPVTETAAELLVRLAREHPGELRVLAIAPLTNLALALRLDPELPYLVGNLTIMGGNALAPGNLSPAAEANVLGDPEAAAIVLSADWATPPTLVPLDVTMTNLLEEPDRLAIAAIAHPAGPALARMLEYYFTFYAGILGRRLCAMHDPLAAAVLVDAVECASAPLVRVEVDTTDGPGRGRTVCDMRGMYNGYPVPSSGPLRRVVLSLTRPFTPHLLDTLRLLAPDSAGPPAFPLTVVGSVNIDLLARCERLPGPGETVGGGDLIRRPGGKGANQAAAAARLAGSCRMIGAVGADADGARMLDTLRAAGVDVSGVRRVPGPTGAALIAIDASGENQIVVAEGANGDVGLDGVEFGPDEAVLTQLETGLPLVEELARKVPGYLALNAAPAMPLPAELISRCDLIIVNETEYALIPGLARASLVAVTYGGDGSALFRDDVEIARVAAQPTTVVDTVGAGDAFCAALVLALRSGQEPAVALATANAVGAFAVTDPSSQPPFRPLPHYHPPH